MKLSHKKKKKKKKNRVRQIQLKQKNSYQRSDALIKPSNTHADFSRYFSRVDLLKFVLFHSHTDRKVLRHKKRRQNIV